MTVSVLSGKDASGLLQGVWLVEISELDAFRRSDVSRVAVPLLAPTGTGRRMAQR